MSIDNKELEQWYYVEWHAQAGFKANALTFVHARNWLAMKEGRDVPWVPIGLFPTLHAAQATVHDLKREWKCEHGGEG
jgi:hypothetical protein